MTAPDRLSSIETPPADLTDEESARVRSAVSWFMGETVVTALDEALSALEQNRPFVLFGALEETARDAAASGVHELISLARSL